MAREQEIGSILLADCGTVMTKAVLLDRVGGQYRFVAQGRALTTAHGPWNDVSVGIRHAVEEITEITGRTFFDGTGRLVFNGAAENRAGDTFTATVSASEPLQVMLGGLVQDLSLSSAERAAAGTYSRVRGTVSSQDRGLLSDEDLVQRVREVSPDVICIAGGVEGGAARPVLELVESAALACALMEPEVRPYMVYAGNSQLRQRVVKIVGGRADLRVADNVRPTLETENLVGARSELEQLYLQDKMSRLPEIDAVEEWSPVELVPTARAFGRLVEYLWHLGDPSRGVLGVDLGAANTTLAAVFDERLSLTISSDLGIAFGGRDLMDQQGSRVLSRWMPEEMTEEEMVALLVNKEIRPTAIPQVEREVWFEQALARAVIRETRRVAEPGWRPAEAQPYPDLMPLCDTIVISGGALTHAPRPGQIALVVLDALEPIGVTTFVLDLQGLAPLFGSVAAVKPLAAVEALDTGGFTNLATVVTPVGRARRGDTVLRVRMQYEDESSLSVEVHYGELEVLPLPPDQEAVLELRPSRNFDVGFGGPGKGGKRRVNGGLVGLVIDARGRPLRLDGDDERRRTQMKRWLWDMGG